MSKKEDILTFNKIVQKIEWRNPRHIFPLLIGSIIMVWILSYVIKFVFGALIVMTLGYAVYWFITKENKIKGKKENETRPNNQ